MIVFRINADPTTPNDPAFLPLPFFINAPDLETAMISFKAQYPDLRIFSIESWDGNKHTNKHINSQWKKVFETGSQTP